MFNYVAIDDEGCIVMVIHPNKEECQEHIQWEKKWREQFKNENNYS